MCNSQRIARFIAVGICMHRTTAVSIWYCVCVCVCAACHKSLWTYTTAVRVAGQSHNCNCCVSLSRVFISVIWQTQGTYWYQHRLSLRFRNISHCNNFTITSYILFVTTALSLLLFLWTNILPDDGWSEKPKHILLSNKINIQYLPSCVCRIREINTRHGFGYVQDVLCLSTIV